MIVRGTKGGFLLIAQHDHGLVSGEFARRFSAEWIGDAPLREDALYAISNHDVGWRGLDDEVLWNPEKERPYSFVNYPSEPKMVAYTEGLDLIASRSPYAALLCSMHYGSFVERSRDSHERLFREQEEIRRKRLRSSMSARELEGIERDFRLLQLCDDLSLFVCLNEPGKEVYPWHKNGFDLFGRRFDPVWEDRETLRFEPTPFCEGFDIALPYRVLDPDGSLVEKNNLRLRVTC
ncbi:MAG: DUF3891 family protein [Rubrobacteraceae bacterium]